jgi:hypothetical protein
MLERVRSRDGDEARQLVVDLGEGHFSALHRPEQSANQAAMQERVREQVETHPESTTTEIAKAVGIRKADCGSHLVALEGAGNETGTVSRSRSEYRDRKGRRRTREVWIPASQSLLTAVPECGNERDPQSSTSTPFPVSPPFKGDPDSGSRSEGGNGRLSVEDGEALRAAYGEAGG